MRHWGLGTGHWGGVKRAIACAIGSIGMLGAPARGQVIMNELPEPVRGMEIVDKTGDRAPLELMFTDSRGREVTLKDAGGFAPPTGKPVVLLMMYYRCPLLCPKTLEEVVEGLRGVEFTVGTEFNFVVVSFDHRDRPVDAAEKKAGALIDYGRPVTEAMRGGWSFLTGSAENARALADGIGFPYRFLPESGEFSHGTVLFVLTPDGRVSRYLGTNLDFPPKDIRLALVEAGEGKLGSLVDRFTLWCYHFDPREGSYTLQAMRVMQIGAGGGAVVLAGVVGWLFWGERKKSAQRKAQIADTSRGDRTAGVVGGGVGA